MSDETTPDTTAPAESPAAAPQPVAAPTPAPSAVDTATGAQPKITQPFAEFHQVQAELERITDPVAAARTAAEHEAAQKAEYGRYVAAEAIDIGGARAFNLGDPVPQGHVSDDGPVYPGQVALRPDAAEPTARIVDNRPAGNASAEEWRAYAVSRGLAPQAVAEMGRDQLRAEFTG